MIIYPFVIHFGKISKFGGPHDHGVKPDEGVAIYSLYEQNKSLFLDHQPDGTTGLARRLNVKAKYCAMRWTYEITSKALLRNSKVMIWKKDETKVVYADIVDWGPHFDTNRIIDVSDSILEDLKVKTDDIVGCALLTPKMI